VDPGAEPAITSGCHAAVTGGERNDQRCQDVVQPGCQNHDPEEETMSEVNKDLVRRHFEEIWNRKDLAVADELMAQDYLERAVAPFGQAEPGRVNGPAAIRQTAEWLLAQFPDLHMTIEAIVAEGDTVAVRVLSEGTNLGPLNGVMPPTGKRFAARQRHWFRVEGGKLAEHWATREDLVAMLQLGSCSLPEGRRPSVRLGRRTDAPAASSSITEPGQPWVMINGNVSACGDFTWIRWISMPSISRMASSFVSRFTSAPAADRSSSVTARVTGKSDPVRPSCRS
jgi:predicted ester cyclase